MAAPMKLRRGNFLSTFLLLYCLLATSKAWDTDDFELFDTVEEVNQNFYELLGVKQDASASQIRRAYRKLTLQYHPDRNKADDAEVKFRQLAAVYEILKDENKRQRYNEVLEQGLPDWRQPIFYYRRVRKMGLMELAVLLFIILTIGQFFVKWAVYFEKKLVMEEAFTTSRKKRDKKKKTKQQQEKQEEEEDQQREEFLSLLPKPRVRDLMPFKLVRMIYHTVTHLPQYYASYKAYQEERKELELLRQQEEEEESEEEIVEEEIKRKPKRRPKVEVPEFSEELYREKPVVYTSTVSDSGDQNKNIEKEGEWSRDEYMQLSRSVAKFPPGTVKRWEKISEILSRPVSEVIEKSKLLKTTYGTSIDPSMQGTTGFEDFSQKVHSSSDNQISERLDETIKNGDATSESNVRHRQKNTKLKKTAERTLSIPQAAQERQENELMDGDEVKVWTQNQQKTFEWGLVEYPKGTPDRWGKIAEHITGKTKDECVERFKFLAEKVKKRKQAAASQ